MSVLWLAVWLLLGLVGCGCLAAGVWLEWRERKERNRTGYNR